MIETFIVTEIVTENDHRDWKPFFEGDRCFLALLFSPYNLPFKEGRELLAGEGRKCRV